MSRDDEILSILELVSEHQITADEGQALIASVQPEASSGQGTGFSSRAFEDGVQRMVRGMVRRSFGPNRRLRHLRGNDATESFPLGALPLDLASLELDIALASARVTVRPGRGRDVVVTYTGPSQTKPSVFLKGNRLEIRQPHLGFGLFHAIRWMMDGPRVDVELPEGLLLSGTLGAQNGTIQLKAFRIRSLTVETSNGMIEAGGEAMDDSSFVTQNGSIQVEGGAASGVRCQTTNGKIDILGVLKNIRLEAVNGKISAEPRMGSQGALRAETVRGQIHVRIPTDLGIQLDAQSQIGSVSAPHASSIFHGGPLGQSIQMNRGDGALRMTLSTQMGSIAVEDRDV